MVPAGPTASPPQDPAEPISQMCGAPVKIHFKNGDKDQEQGTARPENRSMAEPDGTPDGDAACGAEETSTEEGAAGKSEKKVAERTCCALTPTYGTAFCLMEETEHNLQGQ